MMNEKIENYDIFISYETLTGLSYAEHLKDALEKDGHSSFLAYQSIEKGEDGESKINLALEKCKYFVVIITSLTLKSKEVIKEYERAVELEKRIIPCRWKKIKVLETNELSKPQQIEFKDNCELANEVINELKNIKDKEKKIKIDNDPKEFLNRGNLFYNSGDFKKAIEFYEKALELAKAIGNKDVEGICHYNLGLAYYKGGLSDKAIEECKKSIKINPNFEVAHYNLGVAYGKKGLWDEAIEEYGEAIRIKPDYAIKVHNNLGLAYGKKGLYDQAIGEFKETIKSNPDFANAHYNLGSVYLILNRRGDVLDEYKILKELDKESANELFNLIYK